MMKSIRFFLKELRTFIGFFFFIPKAEKSLVIFSEHEGYYPYLEGLVKELSEGHEQDICYVTSDFNDQIYNISHKRIRVIYQKKLLPFFALFVNCRVLIMTLTDLNKFEFRRSVNKVHYVYVFHSLMSTHMIYQYGAFDHYDSILCTGPYQIKEIRKHEKISVLKPKILVKAGYYRLERIYEAYKKHVSADPLQNDKEIILIAPSWGEKNVLEYCGMHLIEILLHAGFEVIVRPHPETVRRSPELIESFKSQFFTNPDFNLELSVATDDSLLRADVLVTDFSGIALEYAFGTERPVLFLDVPAKVRNERYEEIGITPFEMILRTEIGKIHSPDELNSIVQTVNNLIQEKDSYKERLKELRAKNIFSFGHSSSIGAEFISDILKGKDIEKLRNTAPVES